jgi:ribosomal protein L40E
MPQIKIKCRKCGWKGGKEELESTITKKGIWVKICPKCSADSWFLEEVYDDIG